MRGLKACACTSLAPHIRTYTYIYVRTRRRAVIGAPHAPNLLYQIASVALCACARALNGNLPKGATVHNWPPNTCMQGCMRTGRAAPLDCSVSLAAAPFLIRRDSCPCPAFEASQVAKDVLRNWSTRTSHYFAPNAKNSAGKCISESRRTRPPDLAPDAERDIIYQKGREVGKIDAQSQRFHVE